MMLLLGYLAKIQGLKGEFLFHELMDKSEKLKDISNLVLAPPDIDLEDVDIPAPGTRTVKIRSFRFHKNRVCLAFDGIHDRTASESYRNWALWTPDQLPVLLDGESYRHDWLGCDVFFGGTKIGEVARLDATPMGYDMISIIDMRPGRSGVLEVPYVKLWVKVKLADKRIDIDPPPGLLDINCNCSC